MLSEEKTDGAKLVYFGLFVAVNGLSCAIIPFVLDYAHNFLNGIIIPSSLRWDDNNRLRSDTTGWFTAQVSIVLAEYIGLLWLFYRFTWPNTRIWLAQEPMWVARLITLLMVAGVGIVTLVGRGGFLIWLVKKYIKTVI